MSDYTTHRLLEILGQKKGDVMKSRDFAAACMARDLEPHNVVFLLTSDGAITKVQGGYRFLRGALPTYTDYTNLRDKRW